MLWVGTLICAGFFLGSAFPGLGSKLDLVILGLLAVSVIPMGYEWWKHRREQAEADQLVSAARRRARPW